MKHTKNVWSNHTWFFKTRFKKKFYPVGPNFYMLYSIACKNLDPQDIKPLGLHLCKIKSAYISLMIQVIYNCISISYQSVY